MSKTITRTGLAVCVMAALSATAIAFSTIFTVQGTVASYDFGDFGPGNPVPGTVEIQAFTMKPGDVIPWHYHKGLTYVIVVHGTVTEQEATEQNTCGPILTDGPASAFVEPPGRKHTVTNPGPGAAIIYFATVFPKGDPDGDAVFVNPPCN
jgi:quercetin dioxygenase-like cupin family protein